MKKKKILKSEKIRKKNDELRARGKDPLKGSYPMINTRMVGINKANIGIKDKDNSNYMDKNVIDYNLRNRHKDDNK